MHPWRGEKNGGKIIISNFTIDALLVSQFSDKDTVLLEIHKGHKLFYAASVYMDYNDPIVNNLQTLEQTLDLTKGAKLRVAMDSNARSTICHDTTTNNTGKPLEKFIAGNQLYIINEDSPMRTFQSSRGTSNIYLTIVNNPMLADIIHWEIA